MLLTDSDNPMKKKSKYVMITVWLVAWFSGTHVKTFFFFFFFFFTAM